MGQMLPEKLREQLVETLGTKLEFDVAWRYQTLSMRFEDVMVQTKQIDRRRWAQIGKPTPETRGS
jgi:hypothetical protein